MESNMLSCKIPYLYQKNQFEKNSADVYKFSPVLNFAIKREIIILQIKEVNLNL